MFCFAPQAAEGFSALLSFLNVGVMHLVGIRPPLQQQNSDMGVPRGSKSLGSLISIDFLSSIDFHSTQ
jgi:hypothetical protein